MTFDTDLPVVIVGTGMAGYTVARELRKLDAKVPIVLISEDNGCAYSKPALSNALAMKKQPKDLANFDAAAMSAQLNASIVVHRKVERILPDAHEVIVNGSPLRYAKLVLALGAEARRVPLGGDGADEVLSVNSLDDYARFRERLQQVHSVAILGAGLIGCEFANDLALADFQVTLIDPADTPLSRLLPKRAGATFASALNRHGIRLHLGRNVTSVEKSSDGFRLLFADGETLSADLVVSAIGLAPRTALASAAGLAVENGIRTDAWCRTSDPDIYALGDCSAFEGKVQPYVLPIMHAARALARTLSGDPARVDFPVMPITVKTPASPTVIVPPAEAGAWLYDGSLDGLRAVCESAIDGRTTGFALLGPATQGKAELVKAMTRVQLR
jgi:rubredoxin-NAD+ reductase